MAAPLNNSAQELARSFEVPFADITLRAGADGATVRLHRGELALHSGILSDLLSTAEPPPDEIPLPGKSASDLALLTAFMYPRRSRDEGFTSNNIIRLCELGREYDMPELLAAGDDWLAAYAAELVLPGSGQPEPQNVDRIPRFFKLLQLAHDCHFSRFLELGIASWAQCSGKRVVLEKYSEDVHRLGNEVLFRLLSSACNASCCRYCSSSVHMYTQCSNCGKRSRP